MFQERIAQHYARLGRNQKKIADFLTQQYHEAAFINAFALAQRLGVDPATVTRFAQRLGYAGYPELLADIQAAVKSEIRVSYEPPVARAGEEDFFLRALAQEKENLERAMTHVRGDTLAAVISALASARNIYVIGQGLAKGPAEILVMHLSSLLGIPAQLVAAEQSTAPLGLSRLGEKDAVIGISLSALHDDTALMLRLARSRGAKTIGLATSHTSPTASAAELTMVFPGESITGIPSIASLTAVVTALFQVIALRECERLTNLGQGFQANLNWLLEDRGEKPIEEADILRQL